jgi:2-dehydro-3-deoxy-D-arabinonate dehydratase
MIIFKTEQGAMLKSKDSLYLLDAADWDAFITSEKLIEHLVDAIAYTQPLPDFMTDAWKIRAPIGNQEVWAAGVTYKRSRTARMEEAEDAGGSDFYDRVYEADRPELFLKTTAHRVVGTDDELHLRQDSKWIVPEPELTLLLSNQGKIIGFTIGNDLSCRDIEGENPLYLPQAKTFNRCCALGPGILIQDQLLPDDTKIQIEIHRAGHKIFEDSTDLSQMKKKPQELIDYLFRDNSFPNGCFLMTGTGIVPPNDFTLHPHDEIRITIEPIGTLVNKVR